MVASTETVNCDDDVDVIAFVLHDVFQFPFERVAEIVGRTPLVRLNRVTDGAAAILELGYGGAQGEYIFKFLPPGAAKEFFTTGVTPSLGPMPVDLVILKFALGPIALDVSLLSLLGVLVAYLIARSLF